MKTRVSFATVALLATAAGAGAQSFPGAVPAQREPHHHLAYQDATLRVLRVHVAPGDTTLLHEHDPDYFWISIGASEIVNAKLGSPDAIVKSPDMSIHYTPGKFAHVARNTAKTSFDNITIELLQPETNVRNECEEAVAFKPLDCPKSIKAIALIDGGAEHPAFTSDQLHVSLVTIAPHDVVHATANAKSAWVIAVDTLNAPSLELARSGKWKVGVYRATGGWSVQNRGTSPSRLIVVAAAAGSKASGSKR